MGTGGGGRRRRDVRMCTGGGRRGAGLGRVTGATLVTKLGQALMW